jgi:hypothetical protein
MLPNKTLYVVVLIYMGTRKKREIREEKAWNMRRILIFFRQNTLTNVISNTPMEGFVYDI